MESKLVEALSAAIVIVGVLVATSWLIAVAVRRGVKVGDVIYALDLTTGICGVVASACLLVVALVAL